MAYENHAVDMRRRMAPALLVGCRWHPIFRTVQKVWTPRDDSDNAPHPKYFAPEMYYVKAGSALD